MATMADGRVSPASLREFSPSKLFIEFVDFKKNRGTSDNTSSFNLDFTVAVQLSNRISA